MKARHQTVWRVFAIQRKGKNCFLLQQSEAVETENKFARLSGRTWTTQFKKSAKLLLQSVALHRGFKDLVVAEVRLIHVEELIG